jgi:hypothetical protein
VDGAGGGVPRGHPGRVALWHVRNEAMILGLYDNLALGTRKSIALVASLVAALVILQIIGRGHRLPRRAADVRVGVRGDGARRDAGEPRGAGGALGRDRLPLLPLGAVLAAARQRGGRRALSRDPDGGAGNRVRAARGGRGAVPRPPTRRAARPCSPGSSWRRVPRGPYLGAVHRGSREGDDRELRSASGWRRSSASAARW